MLVTFHAVVEFKENRLHGCGKLHIQVKDIYRKGNGNKADYDQQQAEQQVVQVKKRLTSM